MNENKNPVEGAGRALEERGVRKASLP